MTLLLNAYLITVAFSLTSILIAANAIKKELRLIYTKEQLKYYRTQKGHSTNPLVTWVMVLAPILNIFFGLVCTFKYNEILENIVSKYEKIIFG